MHDNESLYISWIIVLIKNKFATDLVSKDAALQYYHNVVVATRMLLVLCVSLNSQDIREKLLAPAKCKFHKARLV